MASLINNYNYSKYIEYCIESVIKQNYSDLEIIVCDDQSTDTSLEVITRYKDHVKILQLACQLIV